MADKEKWELQELVDEATAIGEIRPEMINEYVYEFRQGSRTITDLTAAAYTQIALESEINTGDIELVEMKEGVRYTVWVHLGDQQRVGVCYEPYMVNGKPDRFCYQKALTKATRNAIKQLVPATQRHAAIEKLKSIGALPKAEPQPQRPAMPPAAREADPKNESEADILRKRCFALWNQHNPTNGDGRLPADFWEKVKARFQVQSRATMTLRHWRECLAMIGDTMADNLAKEYEDAKAND